MKIFLLAILVTLVTSCQSIKRDKATSKVHSEEEGNGWTQANMGEMDVYIYQPTTPPVLGRGRALMISLHGCSQTNIDFKHYSNWNKQADKTGMIIALPQVPGTDMIIPMGTYTNRFMGCWNYYGADHSPDQGHISKVIQLTLELLERPDLQIDPNQVYVTGFSSGGTLALTLGCVAPDLYAGVGANSAPAIASYEEDLIVTNPLYAPPYRSPEEMADACVRMSRQTKGLETQIASLIHDNADPFVNIQHASLNSKAFSQVYEAWNKETFSLADFTGVNLWGFGDSFSDYNGPRVSFITNIGMGHGWASGSIDLNYRWISISSIDYPAYVTEFFFTHNRRVTRGDTFSQ
jgi:poly(3-hydroxybutyrate) depolymerase